MFSICSKHDATLHRTCNVYPVSVSLPICFYYHISLFVNTTTDDCKKYNMAYIMQFYDD